VPLSVCHRRHAARIGDGAKVEGRRRAVVVSSQTEAVHMAASNLIELGMTLAWRGFDIDVVPYD